VAYAIYVKCPIIVTETFLIVNPSSASLTLDSCVLEPCLFAGYIHNPRCFLH